MATKPWPPNWKAIVSRPNHFRVMRISVVNWRTSDDDVRRTVEAVAGVLARRRAPLNY
jgi:hypothetical protein